MAKIRLHNLHDQFPNLPERALEFFSPKNFRKEKGKLPTRTIMELAEAVATPGDNSNQRQMPRFNRLNMICQRLADFNLLMVIDRGSWDSHDARYVCPLTDEEKKSIKSTLDYIVYGFPIIFRDFKNSILPIQKFKGDGSVRKGTCFLIADNCLITAAHCVEDASGLAIEGLDKVALSSATILSSKNSALDLCLIAFQDAVFPEKKVLEIGKAEVLDEVIVIGYPNVPTFAEVLAVEQAMISSDITVITGQVSSAPTEIFAKVPLFLISARVRGGFSGGPVINDRGLVVGMVSRQPISGEIDGQDAITQYDNLGYGVAIPHEQILHFVNGCVNKDGEIAQVVDVSSIDFKDFE